LQSVSASVTELERAAGLGLRPALIPPLSERPYYSPEWEPLWEAADGLRVPLTAHVGGHLVLRPENRPEGQAPPAPLEESGYPGFGDIGWFSLCNRMGVTLARLVYSGVFQKYPNLHMVMTEGYAGWMAFAMQFFDHHWDSQRVVPQRGADRDIDRVAQSRGDVMLSRYGDLNIGREGVTLDAPPSFYLKRQAHATFMWDPLAVRNRDLTGLECLLWGNDYPHHEGAFPYSQEWVDKQFAGVPDDEIDQIVHGNAAALFGLAG
jgi:predicted TIM-barrel fold metal-dependent hydrolase